MRDFGSDPGWQGHRQQGATFDRFGLLAWQGADGHFVEIYLDDLRYTAGRRRK